MLKIDVKTFNLIKAGFINAGYDDYIAARNLLNNGYYEQGATLACYAVERYIKSVPLLHGVPIEKVRGHMNNYKKFEQLYATLDTDYSTLLNLFDENFIKTLRILYSHRYYDDIKEDRSFGFLVNQFLGELDYTISIFETIYHTMKIETPGISSKTVYARNLEANTRDLLENNFVVHNLPKSDFMKRETYVYGVYVSENFQKYSISNNRKSTPGTSINIPLKDNQGFRIDLPVYTGKIFLLEMKTNQKKDS